MVSSINIVVDSVSGDTTFVIGRDAVDSVSLGVPTIMSLLTGQDRFDMPLIAATATTVLQMAWDEPHRISISSLVADGDPDGFTDPNRPTAFWARIVPEEEIGQGQNTIDVWRPVSIVGGTPTHVLERVTLFEVFWEGSGLNFNLRTRVADVIV